MARLRRKVENDRECRHQDGCGEVAKNSRAVVRARSAMDKEPAVALCAPGAPVHSHSFAHSSSSSLLDTFTCENVGIPNSSITVTIQSSSWLFSRNVTGGNLPYKRYSCHTSLRTQSLNSDEMDEVDEVDIVVPTEPEAETVAEHTVTTGPYSPGSRGKAST